ncbi:hypothetical protein DCC81_08110 [Chitinophaga parva]|uniref:FAS1 domain-containing protein n=1 Tax=Chitinophaga parva TaxID=2169414 RepID=A0A2T7BP32_9BACT|nr:fasciclin domain-containing protein [Chitinophaga parva]PUZ29400.1 hypothetical protein DCC81_08110 [Chitinophaga parva]
MRKIYILLAVFVGMLTACNKDDHALVVTAKPTLFEYVNTDPQLTLFRAACQRAGMLNDSTFATAGPYTLFAPLDSAMQAAGLTTEKIGSMAPATLAGIVQYHIVQGKLGSDNLVGFYSQYVHCQHPRYQPLVTKNYYGIFINGIAVVQGNIPAGDGIIHKINRVALPPTGTMTDFINNAPDLTMFAATLRILGVDGYLAMPDPVDQVRKASQFLADSTMTVLAPTDAAFRTYGYADTNALKQVDPEQIHHIFDYYFNLNTVFSAAMKGGMIWGIPWFNLQSARERHFRVLADGFTITADGNITPIHIIRADNVANNGVVHVVDQVIVP